MDRDELEKSLERLRAEIGKLGADDEPIKQRMQGVVVDLERQLRGAGDSEHHTQLIESLRGYVEQFEVEHPRMTSTLNRILVSLSNLGI